VVEVAPGEYVALPDGLNEPAALLGGVMDTARPPCRLPFTIGTDKHASYPEAFATAVKEKVLPPDCKLRRVKCLNNVIEQDHRARRRRWRAMQCFSSFHTAERTVEGVEAAHVMREGRVKRLDGRDSVGQAKFVAGLFDVAA